MSFNAYQNDTTSQAIHDLTIENGFDVINLYGNLQITKDQQGLAVVQKLLTVLQDVEQALKQDEQLVEKISLNEPKEIENPFL